jgi:hypothetical protein
MTARLFSRFFLCVFLMSVATATNAPAQELGGAGTVQGTVKDPTGAVMVAATVTITNPVTGLRRETTTDQMGSFVFRNLPPNPYHVSASAQGFETLEQDVNVRTAIPINVDLSLKLAGATQTIQVVGHTDLLEGEPTAHTDVDQTLVDKLPIEAGGGLNQVITMASPGVVADSNGFFHPVGDHAQTQFSIDNQPITDQQSRIYSNQISPDAVQSMEIITGVPPAEYGDKSSLVVHIITKSGLDTTKPTGTLTGTYGSFKTPQADLNAGAGTGKVGDFVSFTGLSTDRFLDPPEFEALHDHGTSQSFFNRLDAHSGAASALHLNVQAARSSFDVPNTIDAEDAGQDQHQKITTFNVAPGYTGAVGSRALFTANLFVRRDHLTYTPSADPFADQPGTVSQDRKLTNVGAKVDFAMSSGGNNVKLGATFNSTKLNEDFTLGLTDPTVNSPCVDAFGDPSDNTRLTATSQCAANRLVANPDFVVGLRAFDLSRGGTPFHFVDDGTIKEQAFYIQDDIKAGNASFMAGVRVDHYDGLVTKSLFQPRLGAAFTIPGSGTVLRASYGRTLETPYNENLLLASSGDATVFGTEGVPVPPGIRDQFEGGIQQGLGSWVVVDVGYFYKRTKNGAYDFGVLFDTPIAYPVSWDHSKLYGLTGRINLVQHGGFSAFTVLGHTNALFFPPGTGGILLEEPEGEFRIDHDQKFQQTTNVQYEFVKSLGAWAAVSWRYDSGLVAGSVPDYATALTLSADQQAAIGLFCGGFVATPDSPIESCSGGAARGAERLVIPADGTEDDVKNPPRIAPRHLFDLGLGVDNLLNTSRAKLRVRFSVVNLTNKEALYNFLSTFSGTHFVTPRAYQVQFGVSF